MYTSFRNPSFRTLLISTALALIAMAVNGSLLIYFVKYYLRIEGSVALASCQATLFLAGLVGMPFWLRISQRLEKHYLYLISAGATSALMLASLLLFGEGNPLGTGDLRSLLVVYGMAGFFSCILWFVPQSMLADIADEHESLTGSRCEGALFGIMSFGQQVATGLAIMLAGSLLQHFIGLVPAQSNQSSSTIYRIGIVYSTLPAIFLTAGAVVMLRYNLTRSRVLAIQTKLRNRHAATAAGGL